MAGSIREQMNAWSWRDSGNLLEQIAAMGEEGSDLLAEQLQRRIEPLERLLVAAALGNATGNGGIAELRQTAKEWSGPHRLDQDSAPITCIPTGGLALHQPSFPAAEMTAGPNSTTTASAPGGVEGGAGGD
jgi:hypothetical protein